MSSVPFEYIKAIQEAISEFLKQPATSITSCFLFFFSSISGVRFTRNKFPGSVAQEHCCYTGMTIESYYFQNDGSEKRGKEIFLFCFVLFQT